MSANQNPRKNIPDTSQNSEKESSNGTKATAQSKRRRNRPHKIRKVLEPGKPSADAQKSREQVKEEKFVHTVFGGMSKDKFNKQKDFRFNQQIKNTELNEPVSNNFQRKVTVTANKSVIVSILDPTLNNEHKLNGSAVSVSQSTNHSSSLNEANLASRINDQFQNAKSSNPDSDLMEPNQTLDFELEKNYVFRIKKVSFFLNSLNFKIELKWKILLFFLVK